MAKSVLQQRLLFLLMTAIAVANPIIVIGAINKEEMTLGWGIWTVVIVPTVIWALHIKDQMRSRSIKGWESYMLIGAMVLQVSSLLFIEERLRSIVFFAMLIEWLTFLLKARKFSRQNIDTIMFYGTIGLISSSFTTVVFEFTTGLNLIHLTLPSNSIYFYVFIAIMGVNVFRNYLDVVSLNTLLLNRSEKGEQAVQENQWFAATFGLVSHNMKTPLANALGQLEITRLRARNIEGADQLTKGLNQIEESIYTTKNTLEETIQLYKDQINHSERGQLHLSDLEEAIKRFGADIHVEYRDGTQHQTIHGSTYFVLHRFLETAVDNALKYSGSVPTVVFTDSQVIVQDFGPGFSDTEINTLGKGIVKSRKGSGLGLYFTNSLLATINWKMKIENNSKGGCLVASKLLATAN